VKEQQPANIDIRNLQVSYVGDDGRKLLALRDVSLTIASGEIVGVAGESGCGKSTLVSTLLRLPGDPANIFGGQVVMRGIDILQLSQSEMRELRGRDLAMVFQDPFTALNPVLTIGQQLVDVQHRMSIPRVARRAAALDALQRVRIADASRVMKLRPHQMSGGMLQRVCIAMALLVRPALLIADEPTTALDALVETEIIDLLQTFRADTGSAILVVSHQIDVLQALCDRLAIMYAGQIIECGELRTIIDTPRHPYTRMLLDCDPARLAAGARRLPSIPGQVSRLHAEPAGCAFVERCPRAVDQCANQVPPIQLDTSRFARCHLTPGESR